MSTKRIRQALSYLDADHPNLPTEARLVLAQAMMDVEAIERAAHMVAVVGQGEAAADRYAEWKAACELLRSIAKDAP